MAKKVLLIAYYWPPSNAAGTHRPLRFARHLGQFGWEPVVLTAAPPFYDRYDANLIERVPKDITVLKAPHKDTWQSFQHWRGQRLAQAKERAPGVTSEIAVSWSGSLLRRCLKGAASWLECRSYHPDLHMRWIKSAVGAALKNFRGTDFQAIFATGGPWSDFEVGYQLSRKWEVPLVLDFRDPWTISFYCFGDRRPAWARAWDRRRLARYLAAAQSVIFMSGTYAECYLAAYPTSLREDKIHIISQGFEPADLYEIPPPQGNCLSVTYPGTIYRQKCDTLFSALGGLMQQHNGNLKIKLTFIGEYQEEARRIVEQAGLTNYIDLSPPMSFDSANEIMKASHALLVLGDKPSPGYEIYMPSKIFHYLALRRPILGVCQPDESRHLLLQSIGAGPLADCNSVAEIEAALLALYQAWESDSLARFLPRLESLQEYMEPNLTAALVRALSGQSACNPYHRGEVTVPPSLQGLLG